MNAPNTVMKTLQFGRTLGRWWVICLFWLAIVPLAITALLAAIPGGRMLALLPAFYLSVPGAVLIGPPDFSAEFVIATTLRGVIWSALLWFGISGVIAFFVVLFQQLRQPKIWAVDATKDKS